MSSGRDPSQSNIYYMILFMESSKADKIKLLLRDAYLSDKSIKKSKKSEYHKSQNNGFFREECKSCD